MYKGERGRFERDMDLNLVDYVCICTTTEEILIK